MHTTYEGGVIRLSMPGEAEQLRGVLTSVA
jgi:hypothetical protein